ncbi:MAG TPA: hypothetical protein VNW53_01435 [Phenylobacterium sp.]|jgi:hypothetical protein|uniref:hypothetical protein n=1 Tax=Phenylobacterium sp. TaxID=1871053 RepID=UPI002BBC0279|nr:hypothetical protein [Phenylobacterium sp.]HXA37636.1 hypothetical protein [Phenylobacterium sp.]
MSKRKPPAEEPKAATAADEPAILARLDSGPGWGMLLAAGGLAVVAGVGVLVFRGFRRRET